MTYIYLIFMNQGALSYMLYTPRLSANLLRHCGGFGDGSVPGTFGPGTGRCDVCHGERFIQPPPGRERGGRVAGRGVESLSSWGME